MVSKNLNFWFIRIVLIAIKQLVQLATKKISDVKTSYSNFIRYLKVFSIGIFNAFDEKRASSKNGKENAD